MSKVIKFALYTVREEEPTHRLISITFSLLQL